jgi:signal transduction histidine kinase
VTKEAEREGARRPVGEQARSQRPASANQAGRSARAAKPDELARQARQRLDEAERRQRDFIAAVSHEFRSPLTSITGFISVLRERWTDLTADERDEFLEIVDRQSRRLSRLVEDLLLAGKIQEHRVGVVFDRIDLEKMFRETIEEEQLRAAPEHRLAFAVGAGAERVVSDELRLRQILINLLDNSIKYSPRNTTITLRCRREGTRVVLTCEDEGPGIPRDRAEYLMEKFTQGDSSLTRPAGGVGLGLYIVRNLASTIGATIDLADRGPGLAIEVRLPVRRPRGVVGPSGTRKRKQMPSRPEPPPGANFVSTRSPSRDRKPG